MNPKILIAGIGNIFLGDDAFGVEVVRRLAEKPWPEGVRLVDFGIRGLDLTYALLDGCDTLIMVDAAPRGYTVGTLFVLEPTAEEASENKDEPLAPGELLIETHGMNPMRVLRLVRAMGGNVRQIFIVGCEPMPLSSDDMEVGLSAPVQRAVEEAVPLIESLVHKIRQGKDSVEPLKV
jgi:hydrogenase maturation protease